MRVVASVQARLGSTRLPGKVLYQLGERRILQWVVDRTNDAECIDKTVVALGDGPENAAVLEYCDRENVESVMGPEEDLLARHIAVAEHTACDILVRITGDCPFVPSAEIDRIVEAHLENDAVYTTNYTDAMPVGTAVDALDIGVLKQLQYSGETHPVKLLRSGGSNRTVAFTDNPEWYQFDEAHLAVDTPSDYWQLSDALSAVGSQPEEISDWIMR